MTFQDKLAHIFHRDTVIAPQPVVENTIDFTKTARIILENQRKPTATYRSPKVGFSAQLAEALLALENIGAPAAQPSAGLNGMATASGQDPNDLFGKLAQAMNSLGASMPGGSIQAQLKARGIDWKPSKDGTKLVFFVINDQTKAPQPLLSIDSATLTRPHDFEEQLFSMIDFASGKSPGSFKQEQEALRAQEKAVRDVAKSFAPPEEPKPGAAAAMPMAAPAPTAPTAPAQAAPAAPAAPGAAAPQPSPKMAGYNAATTAATPK